MEEGKQNGWIKISRKIKNHWLWEDPQKLKWWIDILLTVNYDEKKVLVGSQLVTCGPGQSVMSLETWAKRWRTSKKTVSVFFSLLASEQILVTENLRITTRITVCNYDSYQGSGNESETQRKREVNASFPQLKKEKKERIITLPFLSEIFETKWAEWKDWKKAEKKGEYKTDTGEQKALDGLFSISGENEETAIEIINQSMRNGWQGLFALKAPIKSTIIQAASGQLLKTPDQIIAERKAKHR